jgi:hypothetical protein
MKIYRREKSVEMYVKTQTAENLATPENRHSGGRSAFRETPPHSILALLFLMWRLTT